MTQPTKTIDHYLSIAGASSRMVSAARSSDWDALVSAEEDCAHLIAALEAHLESRSVDQAEQKQRIHILGEILAHDAEIRELTTPWLKRLEELLAGASHERRLGHAYRADFG